MLCVEAALAAIGALAPCAKRLFAVWQGREHTKVLLQLFKQQGDQQLLQQRQQAELYMLHPEQHLALLELFQQNKHELKEQYQFQTNRLMQHLSQTNRLCHAAAA